MHRTVPQLRQLIIGLSGGQVPSGSVPAQFVEDKGAMGYVFLQVLQFCPVTIIPPIPYIHSYVTGAI